MLKIPKSETKLSREQFSYITVYGRYTVTFGSLCVTIKVKMCLIKRHDVKICEDVEI
jgi:hypothetical protein